jgi:hypothetical protein
MDGAHEHELEEQKPGTECPASTFHKTALLLCFRPFKNIESFFAWHQGLHNYHQIWDISPQGLFL